MASAMLSGIADSFSKILMFCGTPSSRRRKSSLPRLATGAPCESVTVVKTLTRRTFTRKVDSSFCDCEPGGRRSPFCGSWARARGPSSRSRHSDKLNHGGTARVRFIINESAGILDNLDANGDKGLFAAANFFRKRFTIGPDGAVLKIFLLPDGYGLLQGVD